MFLTCGILAVLDVAEWSRTFDSAGVGAMDIGRMVGQLWRLLPDDQKDVSFSYLSVVYNLP